MAHQPEVKDTGTPPPGQAKPPVTDPPEPDPSSGRPPGFWQTRYTSPKARKGIYWEFWYLAGLFVVECLLLVLLQCIDERRIVGGPSLRLYSFAILGGLLGGWMFTAQWLINAVASWRWDEDRRMWRCLNPFAAASLALAFYAIIRSGLFQIFSPAAVSTPSAALGLGFLIGYFSDRAIGKLGKLADLVFGTKHGMIDKPSPNGKDEAGKGQETEEE